MDFTFTDASATSDGDVVRREIQQLLSREWYAFAMAPTRACTTLYCVDAARSVADDTRKPNATLSLRVLAFAAL